jgi:LmbE family N-acetylglucosaminyl deacetylase
VLELLLGRVSVGALRILCLGAHSDDLEIGCGGTMLQLLAQRPESIVRWVVFSAAGIREQEARAGAEHFLAGAAERHIAVAQFRESFFPYAGDRIKEYFETIKANGEPDVVFTHYRDDRHQDHRVIGDLTWNTFRRSLILEYEIPKWDGDLGQPNAYTRLTEAVAEAKIRAICATFASQSGKSWFSADTFRALMRLRGIEANAAYAEAFHARKLALGFGDGGA